MDGHKLTSGELVELIKAKGELVPKELVKKINGKRLEHKTLIERA